MATNPRNLSLRPFAQSDEDEVTSWFADAGELRFFAGKRLTWPPDASQWRSIRLDPSISAWTGVRGESPVPVGHGELIEESPDVVRLARLAVAPHERGHGVGREMLASLIEKSRATGHSLITLTVHVDNSTAIRGYRGLGFMPVGTAPSHSNLHMELALD
jgi:ribosomal protein S18 acetylase RimI-like enzyme